MMDNSGGWDRVNWTEVVGSALLSLGVGMIRLLMFLRRTKSKVHWFDLVLEPSLAMFGGMLVWAISEYAGMPDVLQGAFTSIGAYGGTKTIHWAERRWLGGSRVSDSASVPFDEGK